VQNNQLFTIKKVMMKTSRDVVTAFFKAFGEKSGWEDFIADDIVNESPMPTVSGKAQFVQMSTQFLMGLTSLSLDSTICEGNNVALTATYNLALPTGDTHSLKSIETYTIENEKIKHIKISFDTAAMNAFMAKMPQG